MFVVYILYSIKIGKYYIGHTADIKKRLGIHNSGRVKSTKKGIPWQIKYLEEFSTKNDAYRRELQIKKYKGGRAFKSLFDT
ncbi:GIY-YIG nuclease family protein [Candidatus Parcubacteria bacterium]|nr:MAG: GIY-YIG nuclease family protein [Candidatus Parcubacteria bacterium]